MPSGGHCSLNLDEKPLWTEAFLPERLLLFPREEVMQRKAAWRTQ